MTLYPAKPESDNPWEQTKNTAKTTSNGSEETIKEDAEAIDKTIEDGTSSVKSGFDKAWDKLNKNAGVVKDGITQSVGSMGTVAHCVKAAGANEIMTDSKMWNDIKERADSTIEASKDFPGVHIDSDVPNETTKMWNDRKAYKARADDTLEASKKFPCVDTEAEKACGSGFEATADGMDNVNEATRFPIGKSIDPVMGSQTTTATEIGDMKDTKEETNTKLKGIETGLANFRDATNISWEAIKARTDATLKASKDFPGVDIQAEKACGSGFEASSDGTDDVNAILNGAGNREDDTNLTEKTFDSVKEGVNKTWDAVFPNVDAKTPESNEDIVGSGEDDTKFVIKGGFNREISAWKKTKTFTIDAANSTADAIETGYDAVVDGACTAWNSTVGFLEHAWDGKTKCNDSVDNTNEEIEGGNGYTRNETSKASETIAKLYSVDILVRFEEHHTETIKNCK